MDQFVPDSFSTDQARFLTQLVLDITAEFDRKDRVNKYTAMPAKLGVGRIYYFSNEVLPDIKYPGFWGYEEDGWVYLSDRHTVEASYGGIIQAADIPYPNIDGNWQTVQFDAAMLGNPKNVIQDVVGNALTIQDEGVYRLGFTFSVRHNEVNNGRALNFRLRNPVSGFASDIISVGTGRNLDATYFAISMLVEAVDTGIGSDLIVEVRADTTDSKEIYSSVLVTETTFDVNSVSERL